MKKYFASILLIVTFAIFVVFQQKSADNNNGAPSLASTDITPSSDSVNSNTSFPQSKPNSSSTSSTPNNSTNSSSTTPQTNTGRYKNGTFTGTSADAYYGNVQVQATVKNGKITDVQFLDHPQDRSRSMMINNQSMPMLRSEAIQAQSANVDAVSGATMTSEAFIQSLQSALDQAAN